MSDRFSLDLYPDPGPLSEPPTWADIERLAAHYPAVQYTLYTVHRRNGVSREEALIRLVWWFAQMFSQSFKRERDALAMELLDQVVMKPCGCADTSYVRKRWVSVRCEAHREK